VVHHLLDGGNGPVGEGFVFEHCLFAKNKKLDMATWRRSVRRRYGWVVVDLQKASSSRVRPDVSGNMK
jgi:hypothetical protein